MRLTVREGAVFALVTIGLLLGGLWVLVLLGVEGLAWWMRPVMRSAEWSAMDWLNCLIPLALLALVGLGTVGLLSGRSRPADPPPPITGLACPACRRLSEPDWRVCPYCGTPLGPAGGDSTG